MERRTNAELIDDVRDVLDVAGSPYFSDAQVANFLNRAYMGWFMDIAREAEGSERERAELTPLITEPTELKLTNGRAEYKDLTPGWFRTLAIASSYSDCNDDRATDPMSWDQYYLAQRDPYHAPTEREPKYLTGKESLTIKPTPRSAKIVYLAKPRGVDPSKPDDTTEVDYEVQQLLISRAAALLSIPQGDLANYQALGLEAAKIEQ